MGQRKSSTHYVAILIRHARSIGLDVEKVLRETGIPTELAEIENAWIDNDLLASLVNKLWSETNNETFGLDPNPMRIGTWALACEFMLGADTLGALLRKGERVLSFLAPSSAGLKMQRDGDCIAVLPQVYLGEADPDHFLIEFLTVLWHRFPSWAIDERIPLQEAFFSYPEPNHSSFYEELFSCDVRFNEDACGFKFHESYLKRPITRTLVELEAWLRDSPADLLYMPGREKSIQAQLKASLIAITKDSARYPAFESLCSDLAMSPQVVRRRLADEGTSYQNIKNAIRCETAQSLLANPEVSIIDVALRTGFSEPAAFSRAFKKWTGESPAHYRAGLLVKS
ncbi:MAG: AraC family transcriptional regulator [Halioglobus sp.]